jgi:hypothetical protein
MLAIPGIVLLVFVVYIRPQEFVEELSAAPLLYVFTALAMFGLVIDVRIHRTQLRPGPQLWWALLFGAWCMLTLGLRARPEIPGAVAVVGTPILMYLVIAHGVQTFRGLEIVGAVLLAIVLFLSAVAVHQGFQPFECHRHMGDGTIVSDGRSCVTPRECEQGDPEPGADYSCEHRGLFGTSSIGTGRVRYRGNLNDPNELSLAVGIGMPLAFAFFERRRSIGKALLALLTVGLVAVCTVLTQSRGGQLVFMAVLGCYFVRRFGVLGLSFGALLSAPMLLLGGRSGAEAESSTIERLNCWYEGMTMFREYPFVGVGQGQFVEHYIQTAHNSYILTAAELGLPGMFLWSVVIYLSIKIPVAALRGLPPTPESDVARTWAMALIASQVGLLVGILFLSFAYHPVLWIYVGLSGALYSAVKQHAPEWRVRCGVRDLVLVAVIDLMLVVGLYGYTRIRGAP